MFSALGRKFPQWFTFLRVEMQEICMTTCHQLAPSISLRHLLLVLLYLFYLYCFSILCHLTMLDLLHHHIEKQGGTVTSKWTLLKWPHWLQILPLWYLTPTSTILTPEMMSLEPLHTQPMFPHSPVFLMHSNCQLHSHRMKLPFCNWRLQHSRLWAIRASNQT